MSDEFVAKTQKELMRNMYEIQKESVANDAELKAQMSQVMKRLDKTELVMDKISQSISGQKALEGTIRDLNKDVNKKFDKMFEWKSEQEKRQAVEGKSLAHIEKKIDVLFKKTNDAEKRIDDLENKNARTVFSLVKKIGAIILGVIVTTIVGYFLGKMKGGM